MNTSASIHEGTINPDTGAAPDRRFLDPKDKANGDWVHNQIKGFKMVGDTKDTERREVEAMLRHAPPYSQADLRALNMENAPNSTMGELPKRISEEEAKWTNYVVSSTGLWEITFPWLPGQLSDLLKEQVSELLNNMWSDDPRHVLSLQLCFRQLACYGIGPLIWNDCYDPSPVARIASDVKFTPGTRLTLDNFSECSLRDTCTPQELYATIRGNVGAARAKLHGWNRAEVMKVLKFNATGNVTGNASWNSLENIELLERQGTNIWNGYQNREIELIHVFIKEYEEDEKGNSFSHVVLAHNGTNYRIIRDNGYKYSNPSQFGVLASDRVGSDLTIEGLRGLGVDIIEQCRSMDIMYNGGNGATYRKSVPVYATTGGNGASSADQISVRPNGVIIPPGYTEVESHVDPQLSGHMLDRISNQLDRYQGLYDVNSPNKGGVQRTAAESKLDAAKESETNANQILPIVSLFFEPLGREFWRRLMTFPKDKDGMSLKYKGWAIATVFWDKLNAIVREYGIPPGKMMECRIKANPNNTPGGYDKKLLKAQASMAIYPYLQSQKQRNWVVNNNLIGLHGYQAAKPYLNKDEPEVPTEVNLVIDGENADIASGYQRRVFPDQDHLRHLGPLAAEGVGHVPFMMAKLAEMQQGVFDKFSMDAIDTLSHQLRAGVTMKGHMDAHLVLLSQNPVIMDMPEVQGYFDFAAQLEQILLQSIKHFEKQMQERNPGGPDPKNQAMLAKTRAEIEAMQMRTNADIQMMNQKHMVKLGNQTQTAEARRDQKNAQFILDEIIKQKQATTDLAVQGMGHVMDLKAEEQKQEIAAKNAAKKPKAK